MHRLIIASAIGIGLLAMAANHDFARAQSFDFVDITQMIEAAQSGCDPSSCVQTQTNSNSYSVTVSQH